MVFAAMVGRAPFLDDFLMLVITPTLGAPIPVLLTFDAAVEALQALSIQYGVFQSIYNHWKEQRQRWQETVLRRLQVSICSCLDVCFESDAVISIVVLDFANYCGEVQFTLREYLQLIYRLLVVASVFEVSGFLDASGHLLRVYATSKFEPLPGMSTVQESFSFQGEPLSSISKVSLLEVFTNARGLPNSRYKVIKGILGALFGMCKELRKIAQAYLNVQKTTKAKLENVNRVFEIVKTQLACPCGFVVAPDSKFSAVGADSLDTMVVIRMNEMLMYPRVDSSEITYVTVKKEVNDIRGMEVSDGIKGDLQRVFFIEVSDGVKEQTATGKENSNPLIADSLLKTIREDGSDEVISNLKVSNLHSGEWREVIQACPDKSEKGWKTIYDLLKTRLDQLTQTEQELMIDLNKHLKEQDPLNELNVLANNKRKRTSDLKDHYRDQQDAIEFAIELMDQKICTFADRQAENKRKLDDNSRNNQNQQQPFKRQNVARAYTAGPREKKVSPAATANNQRAPVASQRVVTCFECGVWGHYKKDCPKLKNNNHGNQAGNGRVIARAYAVGNAGKNPDANVVISTFL
ncbi:putative reverse transcriptase domain-containing protein [Tanacetum coccineum]